VRLTTPSLLNVPDHLQAFACNSGGQGFEPSNDEAAVNGCRDRHDCPRRTAPCERGRTGSERAVHPFHALKAVLPPAPSVNGVAAPQAAARPDPKAFADG
jgi:hypothetical protein